MRAIVILLASVVIPLGAHDAHGKKSAAPAAAKALQSPLTPEQAKSGAGRDLYSKACAGCHGSDGKSSSPEASTMKPRPTDLADHRMDSMKDGEIFWVITKGIGKVMPGFQAQLSDIERWRIVAYVRQLRKGH